MTVLRSRGGAGTHWPLAARCGGIYRNKYIKGRAFIASRRGGLRCALVRPARPKGPWWRQPHGSSACRRQGPTSIDERARAQLGPSNRAPCRPEPLWHPTLLSMPLQLARRRRAGQRRSRRARLLRPRPRSRCARRQQGLLCLLRRCRQHVRNSRSSCCCSSDAREEGGRRSKKLRWALILPATMHAWSIKTLAGSAELATRGPCSRQRQDPVGIIH